MPSIAEELQFLKDYPHFEERPASIVEFVGDGYLNIAKMVRPAVMDCLVDIFGDKPNPHRIALYELGMFTGGIGIGKTTLASIVLPYFTHWVMCLRNPQEYYNLLPGSRIAFMQMSTSGTQALQVVYSDVKARVDASTWFKDHPYDPKFKRQLRFDKEIWIIPGDSTETTFEGYNILAGILDEADSHKITKVKDYAEQGFTTIQSRIESRFENQGFLLVAGQMKSQSGFAARKYKEFTANPKAYTKRLSIWESFGWQKYSDPETGERLSFYYDPQTYRLVEKSEAEWLGDIKRRFIEVPETFRGPFLSNPIKALRDLAGLPPAAGSPFIPLVDKIDKAQMAYYDEFGYDTACEMKVDTPIWRDDFEARNTIKRVAHIDIAVSEDGDALGFAMGHVRGMVEDEDGERKPYIVIDCVARIVAPAGREIFLGDIRRMIYHLRDDRKFKIVKVTTDGFQSTDTRQQLERRRIATEVVSVDKDLNPYYDLRDAIYEERIAIPKLMVLLRIDDDGPTNIVRYELSNLTEADRKIDHPPEGSKDVADAIAGVTYTLMSDKRYHARTAHAHTMGEEGYKVFGSPMPSQGFTGIGAGMSAPIPPTSGVRPWMNGGV